ncbi:hypothetical protein DX914_19295 [Lysobacter silvisoli]|uniref:Outer membrane protein assembly factor BamE n=1 Tax=Lysobacter silvisoli TaxID=2293254 RepID=A0A371JWH8_9GAMM|nr:hypothetical protein DX914_19295 [Lysobacter silvisoli]
MQVVFLYGGGKEGYHRYGGSLGPGLSFDASRADVESVLGVPARNALPGKTLLGSHGGWLRYDYPVHSVHFAFDLTGRLELVTLMTAEARPQ